MPGHFKGINSASGGSVEFAVTSTDGMMADSYPFPHAFLACTATRIVNEVRGINRVVYDLTLKLPDTIDWSSFDIVAIYARPWAEGWNLHGDTQKRTRCAGRNCHAIS